MYDLSFMLKRIKEEEKKKGYKHEDLARKAEIPLGTLSKVLAGITKDPSVTTIIKIANALEVSADYLIYGKKESFQNKEIIHSIDEEHIILSLQNLNNEGLQRVKSYIDDISSNPKYILDNKNEPESIDKILSAYRAEISPKTLTEQEALEELRDREGREYRTDRLNYDGITHIAAFGGGVHEFYDDENDEEDED